MTPEVFLCECFARDGLQHEPEFVPTDTKRELVERFASLGFPRVEATSYSNPAVVPQFADASELMQGLTRHEGVTYKATCANLRAVSRAIADLEAGHGADEISLLVSATESHSERNLKRSRQAQWEQVTEMAAAARGRFQITGTISVALGCPFEGAVAVRTVLDDVQRFAECGATFVMLADTTGMGTPATVRSLFKQVLWECPQVFPIAHFHDSRGTGLVNCVAALETGVRHFDCAFGGVGGHPARVKYGGGHTGNVCTEDWISLLESLGMRTGIDLQALLDTSAWCEAVLRRPLHSRVRQTGLHPLIAH